MNEKWEAIPDIPLVQYQIPDSETVVYARDNDALIAHLGATVAAQSNRIEELDYLAHHDALTGLPDRRGLERAFDDHVKNGDHFALEIIDIVNFKVLNDTTSYDMGDLFLKQVLARDIFSKVRELDVPASLRTRLGGDEFGTLVMLKKRDFLIINGNRVPNTEALSDDEQLTNFEARLSEVFANHPFVKKFNSFMPEEFRLNFRAKAAVYSGQTFDELKSEASPDHAEKESKRDGFKKLKPWQIAELEQILQQQQ